MEKFKLNFRCEFEYGDDILLNVYENDKLIYSERMTWNALGHNHSLGIVLRSVLQKRQDTIGFTSFDEAVDETEDRLTNGSNSLGLFKKIRRCQFFRKKIDFKA